MAAPESGGRAASWRARVEAVIARGDQVAVEALREELVAATEVGALDRLWRERPVEATLRWGEAMEARRRFASHIDWPGERGPGVAFAADFAGELWLIAAAEEPSADRWRVVVHPAPGLMREAEHARAGEVRWYLRDAPPPHAHCWFVHDRDCFIEIRVPGAEQRPYFLRRTQPSFGRWRIRRSLDAGEPRIVVS